MFPFQRSTCSNWLNLNENSPGRNPPINSVDGETATATAKTRSHKEAERHRRQRINAHLSTLRSLLPNNPKTDKASLLAEVVSHVKKLRGDHGGNSGGGSDAWWSQAEADEVNLSFCDDEAKLMKAIVCCEDRPGLVLDLTQAIRSVRARPVRAEMMTIGGRTKNAVVLKWTGEEDVTALKRALKAVVENRISDPPVTRNLRSNKRARI